MSSFKKIKKASKYADCKNSGKGSLLKYYGVKTERREELILTYANEPSPFLEELEPGAVEREKTGKERKMQKGAR